MTANPARPIVRRVVAIALGGMALLGPAAPAFADDPKPASASTCIATWYANRTFGNVGEDTRYFATLAPGEVGRFSSAFAHVHAGSVDACLGALGG